MKKLSFSFVVFVSALLVLEMLARIAGTIDEDISERAPANADAWMRYSPIVGWERRPGYEGDVGGAERAFDDAGYFTADSDEITNSFDRKKVVFIGDSNTFGWGAPTPASFVEVAEKLLPNVDAINLGVVGYSSHQGRVLLEKQLPLLEPDLVVVSFNFNDRRYVLPPQAADGPAEFQRAYEGSRNSLAGLMGFLETSHFYRGLRRVMRKVGLVPQYVGEVDVTRLEPRVDEDAYRSNLAQIGSQAERFGIPVLFVLLRDDPIQSDHLKRGIASLENRDYDLAIAYLRAAANSHMMFRDLARLYLVRTYELKGDEEKAAEVALAPSIYRSFTGGTLIRSDVEYNEIMRQVAAESDAALLDGAAVLEEHPSVFVDFCHFDADGHRLLGERLAERISEILGVGNLGSTRSPEPRRRAPGAL
jgi:lysophospholipase L1-like esterase